jgi:multidrug efflux pump subunit AcrA (membrane-fusion protein)
LSEIRNLLTKPWVVMPLVAALVFGGWFAFVRNDGSSSSPNAAATTTPRTVEATVGTLARTVSADGTVAAAETDDLSFTSAGTVTAVNVKAGQTVKKGQVLATIDSAALESSVAEAESNVADAQATLSDDTDADASDEQLAADESALTTAQDALSNAQEALGGAKLVSTFDGTVASVGIAVGDELSSNGAGGTDQTGTDSGSGNTADDLGSGSNLPSGNNSNGNSSNSSSAQIQVVSSGKFTVDLGLDSSDIANVKLGQVASITVSTASSTGRNGFPGGFRQFGFGNASANANSSGSTTTTTTPVADSSGAKGIVTEVGSVADASSGVASYPVTVAFNDTTGTYHVGANVTVAITYAEVKDAVQVPSFAVSTSTDGTSTVTVLASGKEQTRTVTTGLTSGAMVQITSGLKAGEQVVLSFPGAGANRAGSGGANSNRAGGGAGGPQVITGFPGGGAGPGGGG